MLIHERLNITSLLLAFGAVAATTGCAVATDEDGEVIETQEEALIVKFLPVNDLPTRLPKPSPLSRNSIVELSAGRNHTCLRKLGGSVHCWGMSSYGQAGAASTTCLGVPCVLQPTNVGIIALQVELGYDHTCALDTSGQALCWGANHNQQLGNGSWSNKPNFPAAAQPAKFNGAPIIFSQISSGDHSTCGVTSGTGNVFCWGIAGAGAFPAGPGNANPAPLANAGGIVLDRITSAATWFGGACIQFTLTGNLGTENYCFTGMSANGRSTLVNSFDAAATRTSAQGVSACADKTNGTVECLGNNMLGELGNGTTTTSNVPVTVGGGMALHGVSMGQHHACALDPAGTPLCWGNLANGGSMSPVAVATPVPLTTLASGDLHTCGLGSDGSVYCWGDNTYGQIGNGTSLKGNLAVTRVSDPI